MCMNIECRLTVTRGNLLQHKRNCRFRKVKCQNTNCGEEFTPKDFKTHKDICPHLLKNCPNHKFGCEKEVELKYTKNHLEVCRYAMVECDLCITKIKRMDLSEHKKQKCPHGPATCVHCNNVFKQLNVDDHMTQCKVKVSCDNVGCGIMLQKHEMLRCSYPGCSFTAPKDSLMQHSRECDYRKQLCDTCGNSVAIKDMNWHKKVEDVCGMPKLV